MPPKPNRRQGLALLALSGTLLAGGAARALQPDLTVRQLQHQVYGAREGLPQADASCLISSRRGFLWICTEAGVARFDGSHFTVFDREHAPALPNDRIQSLAEGLDGDIWVATESAALLRVPDGTTSLVLVRPEGQDEESRALTVDQGGDVWMTTTRHLLRFHQGTLVATLSAAEGLPPRGGGRVVQDGLGRLWMTSSAGLFRLEGDRLTPGPPELRSRIQRVARARDGGLWLVLEDGVVHLSTGLTVGSAFPISELPQNELGPVLEDREGTLWVGTHNGLARVRDGHVLERFDQTLGLSDDEVVALAEDAEGNLWVGTGQGGLNRLRSGDVVNYGRREGLPSDVVYAVAEDAAGAVWVGTSHGVARIGPGDKVEVFGRAQGLRFEFVSSLAVGAPGEVFVGTQRGVAVLRGGRFSWLDMGEGPKDPFAVHPSRDIFSLLRDSKGHLYAGSAAGVSRLSGERFVPLGRPEVTHSLDLRINALAEDSHGQIWVGSDSDGLLRVEGDRLVPGPEGGPPPGAMINALASEPDGTLWIGTYNQGLWRLRDGRFSSFGTRHGLREELIYGVVDDRQGHLWLSGAKGIQELDLAALDQVARSGGGKLTPISYGVAEGMRDAEGTGGTGSTCTRTRDGKVWFSTVRGLAVIDPQRPRHPMPPPPALLERAVADGRDLPSGRELTLLPRTQRLELHYQGISFSAPERLRFRYRLFGFDDDWAEAGSDRVAHYTNLRPGDYQFVVQASLGDGAWSTGERPLVLHMLPAWWQTSWFAVTTLVLLALLLYAGYQLRVRHLREKAQELEQQVAEALRRVQTLAGLLPICAWCKKVRDDHGYWTQIEAYVSTHSRAEFSHGICPDCYARQLKEADGG